MSVTTPNYTSPIIWDGLTVQNFGLLRIRIMWYVSDGRKLWKRISWQNLAFLCTYDYLVWPHSQPLQQFRTTIFYALLLCMYVRDDYKLWPRVVRNPNYDVYTAFSAIIDTTAADPFHFDCKLHVTILTASRAIPYKSASLLSALPPARTSPTTAPFW